MTGYFLSSTFLNRTFLYSFFLLLFVSAGANAQGGLLLFPKRIVFEGAQKSQTLNLANSGKDTVRYIISVMQIRMKKDGAFETISQPDSGQRFADKFFRFFPRSVVLAPNEAQSVKIQLINTAEMEPGEYRSHIYFRAEQDKKPLGEEKQDKSASAISVDLVAVYGISIPLIIRVGTPSLNMQLTGPSLEWKNDTLPSLKVTFNRSGNVSSFGDVAVDYVSQMGQIIPVGVIKGVAVYTPNAERRLSLQLENKKGINYHQGKLRITYTTQADAKAVKMAETELVLK